MRANVKSRTCCREKLERPQEPITPYWRVVKDDGSLNPKFPGGEKKQADHLRSEGRAIARKGKKFLVNDSDKSLVVLE